MTAAVSGIRPATPPAVVDRTSLRSSDFLALMTAELKNQDPTKPVDNAQYLSQLSQMSTVQGIGETNNMLATIATKLDALIAK